MECHGEPEKSETALDGGGTLAVRKEPTVAEPVLCLEGFPYGVSRVPKHHVDQLYVIHTLCIRTLKQKRIRV